MKYNTGISYTNPETKETFETIIKSNILKNDYIKIGIGAGLVAAGMYILVRTAWINGYKDYDLAQMKVFEKLDLVKN